MALYMVLPYIRYGLICGVAFYSVWPYMWCRLTLDAASYVMSHNRRRPLFKGILFVVPHYFLACTIFSPKKYFHRLVCVHEDCSTCDRFQHYAFKLLHININIEACHHSVCVTRHKTLYGHNNNCAWIWNGIYYHR